ncbi:MerR family transcriptional regulator [Butyrivibrio sp. AE3009]|uniref:MerR family transcriptional regulator n=1 Tax=Butyrivibrio sp. AE3009 TaxID=1280666 RepID=UPI0003B64ED5|nr:MerR family transcriptional regulator [Butyrivibrio sp. AE3009]
MTIKEFACLCGCNPQTLRYYDRMNLLKPVKVDEWTGYRYYEEKQALDFVKIKNLQTAGFTIEEIREYLDADDETIAEAFGTKIQELEDKLQKIKEIRRSYQHEMTQMKERIEELRAEIKSRMEEYDPRDEFGLSKEDYQKTVDSVDSFFDYMIERAGKDEHLDWMDEESKAPSAVQDYPGFEVVYEKHGWSNVRDFYEEFAELENGRAYALLFKLSSKKSNHTAFANIILSMLMAQNEGKSRQIRCAMDFSEDGQNHFWLLGRKMGEDC